MLPPCPSELKPIVHYVKIAQQYSSRDPVVHYWALLYAAQRGMSIDKKSPGCPEYLSALLTELEQAKQSQQENEALSNDIVAQAHVENVALKLFQWADTQDRACVFNKNVIKAFYTAGHILDVLEVFNPTLDEQLEKQRKYAKWKAAYIHNCLSQGETPHPGPIGEDEDEHEAGDVLPTQPSSTEPPPTVSQPGQPAPVSAFIPPSQPSSTGMDSSLSKVQKLCKYAISAVEYEDIPTAIQNLKEALLILEMR